MTPQVPIQDSQLPNSIAPVPTGNDPTGGGADFSASGAVPQSAQPDPTWALQQQIMQGQGLETPDSIQQRQQQSALQDQIGRESQALQSMQPTSNRGGPVKKLLYSFIRGAGDAMRRDVGLPTDQQIQQQHVSNLVSLSNAQAMDSLRQAQVQGMQLVTRQMPDGNFVQIPQAHVATFDASMARSQTSEQQPNLNDLIGRSVYAALQANRDPNQDPVVNQLLAIQKSTQKPQPDTAAVQKDQFMQGIQPAIQAGEIKPAMLTDVRQLITGIQNSQAISADKKPGLVSWLIANPSPAAQGTQAQVKVAVDNTSKTIPVYDTQNKNSLSYLTPEQINAGNQAQPGRYTQAGQIASGAKTGYAFDPNTNQTVLTNPQEAAQNGYQAFRPVTEANIRNDSHDIKILNDIAVKANNVTAAAGALDSSNTATGANYMFGATQREIIAQAIAAADKDEQFRMGAFGTQIPTTWLNNILNSNVMKGATQQTKDYVVSLLSLREAAMGMQRLLTGTARSSESQIQALQSTLPGLEPNSALARQKMAAFTQNLQMLRQGLPQLPGMTVVPLQGDSQQVSPDLQRYLSPLSPTR